MIAGQTCSQWLEAHCSGVPEEIAKETDTTRAWFARVDGRDSFVKAFPRELDHSWVKVERAIAGQALHPAIVPLRKAVTCVDGTLLVYDRVAGENLGPSATRDRFMARAIEERGEAVIATAEALAAICEAGFMVVDWYEGNMLYDFEGKRVWLFDWELCREGGAFVFEMASNYGSSRLMAPEEFVRGSVLDEVTLVFNVGRFALLYLPELADTLAPVLAKATYPSRKGRYRRVRELARDLRTCFV